MRPVEFLRRESTSDLPRTVVVVFLAAVVCAADARGQRPDRESQHLALSGLTVANPRVIVQWDMAVTMRGGTTRSDFEESLRLAFELGLGDTGVGIDASVGSRVDCVVTLTYAENVDPSVVLRRTVRLMEPVEPEETLGPWTVAWSQAETYAMDRDALSGSEVGRDCAEAFGRDWRRANPG